MKHHIRALASAAALLSAVAMVLACGGRETVASKSAAAYDEARKKGVPVTSGEHGAHAAEPVVQPTAIDHTAMAGMDHSSMAGMDHAAMPGMDHAAMPGMDHPQMAGMEHAGPAPASLPPPPASNAAIARLQPAATLRADELDAPSPLAVQEAAKAATGMESMEGGTPPQPTPERPPKPPSAHQHHHGGGGAS